MTGSALSATPATPRLVWHVRLAVLVVAFAALAFRQSSGLIVPDTKLDLTADPGGFLTRALHLWDPRGAFGQLQNQAYGYLFPVGPFHLVLESIGLPGWVVQRLWWTAIFSVALVGTWLLTRALGVANPWARLAAAAAYALSPRIISEVAITSVEVWPMAVAPWVLLPLLGEDRSVRWQVTRSALAFALIGGVNAVASGAALVLPALWLVTRRWNLRLLRLAAAWFGSIVLVSAWWLVPLVLLGRYSPPFLDWIENASVTTGTASVFEAFRGASAWLAFLSGPTGPSWPAGWLYVVTPVLIIGTTIVAAAGLVGMVTANVRERGFLVLALVVGLALVTFGHVGDGSWPMADGLRTALDGPLAPLRNTHKFELVIRIPLAIGFAHAVARGADWFASWSAGTALARLTFSLLIPCLIVVVAAPGIGASMARAEGYSRIPGHWREAAAWLDGQPRVGSVYITPAASFSDLTWGSTKDEPLQALMKRPFVVRDAVPLGSAGATRLLDSVEDRLSEGQRVDGLESVLARSGIAYVLVRNELRLDAQGSPPPVVSRALEESGLSKVAGFGPLAGAYGESATLTVDYRTLIQRDAIEIYAVDAPVQARLVPAADLSSMAGGPENLLQAAGPLAGRDVMTGTDAMGREQVAQGTTPVITDGRRHREVNFGEPTKQVSGLLEAGDRGRSGREVIDYESDPAAARTVLEWQGLRSVTASSSASDATATLRTGPANGPRAAVDGDPRTRWISGTFGRAVGEWLQVDFSQPTRVVGTTAEFTAAGPVAGTPLAVRVETEGGATTAKVFAGPALRLPTPPGVTSWLRLTLVDADGPVQSGFSIAEVSVPGVAARPTATLPAARSAPSAVLLEEGVRGRTECLGLDGRTWCSPTLGLPPEENGWRRTWTAGNGGSFEISGTVRPLDGFPLERLLALPSGWAATASSRLVSAPAGRPDAGIDADSTTGWVAGPHDPAPWYEITLPTARVIHGLQVSKSYELPASTPVVVGVQFSDGTKITARANASGEIVFPPIRTTSLRLTFGEVRLLENIDSRTGHRSFAPVGFSELVLRGAEGGRLPLNRGLETGVPCGFGPSIRVNGTVLPTAVAGTIDDILTGRSLEWVGCSDSAIFRFPAGRVTVEAEPSGEFAPRRLDLVRTGLAQAAAPTRLDLTRTSPVTLTASVPGRHAASVLVVSQNFNPGWTARDGSGHELAAVRVNGWQQGWVLPVGGQTRVTAEFAPDDVYRLGLLMGLGLLVLMAALARGAEQRPRRRPTTGGVEGSRVTGIAAFLAAGMLIPLAGGWPGLAGVLMALALALSMRGVAWPWWRGSVALTATTSAAVAVALRPWPTHQVGTSSWPVQTMVWLAVSVVVLGLASADRGARRRSPRMSGRSTA